MDDPDSGDAHPGEYPLFDRTEAWPATGDGGRLCLFAQFQPSCAAFPRVYAACSRMKTDKERFF